MNLDCSLPCVTSRLQMISVILVSRMISRLSPGAIARVLAFLSRGSAPATAEIAERAYTDVTKSSIGMAGPYSCLPRSISVALLCRMRGYWPRWCVGARMHPPFAAHAWVESPEGRAVGEMENREIYQVLLSVGPSGASDTLT